MKGPTFKKKNASTKDLTMLLYGANGAGKTTTGLTCNSAGSPEKSLLLACDMNFGVLPFEDVPRVELHTWADWRALAKGRVEIPWDDFDTVVVDSVTILAVLCQRAVCDALGIDYPSDAPHGKAWDQMDQQMTTIALGIRKRAKNVVWIAQENTATMTNTAGRETTRFFPDVQKTVGRSVKANATLIGRLVVDPKTGERTADFRTLPDQDAKDTAGVTGGRLTLKSGKDIWDKVKA